MKPADPNLVALFDSVKNFVMWEEYTFSFPDQSTLVLSTKDVDATVSYPPPPPPPPPGIPWLLDTFTGTLGDTLATHVGEVGAAWSAGTASASDFVLTGDGNVQYTAGPGTVIASGLPPSGTADFYLELEFTVYEFDQAEIQCTVGGSQGVRMKPFGSSGVVKLDTVIVTGSDFKINTYNTGLPMGAGESYVAWCEVTDARKTVTFGVGAARGSGAVATLTLIGTLPTADATIMYISGPTSLVSRIEGGV